MLATETQEIADYFKSVMEEAYPTESTHFADTSDTLCYATNDNQESTNKLLENQVDLSLVVGGYNSSNTSHIVELLEGKFPTYFINSEEEILSEIEIRHFDWRNKRTIVTTNFLPRKNKIKVAVTSGASCPDSVVDKVILKLLSYFNLEETLQSQVVQFQQ